MKSLKFLLALHFLAVGVAFGQGHNVMSVATIAELRLLRSGTAVHVEGYYAANDGGGGMYVWSPTSMVPDNGGTVIAPTGAVIGRWFLQYSGRINVLWFGAYSNASNDSTTTKAIKAAISAAESAGVSVYFPAGTYNLNSPIVITATACMLYGDATGISRLQSTDPIPGDDVLIFRNATGYAAFNGIRDISIDGNPRHSRFGLALYKQSRFYARRGGIVHCRIPLYVGECEVSTISGMTLESNVAATLGGTNVYVGDSTTTFELNDGCYLSGSGDGIYVDPTSSVSMANSTIESNGRYGINVDGSFSGTRIHFEGNTTACVYSGHSWSPGGTPARISLVDCNMLGPVGSPSSYCVQTDFASVSLYNCSPSNTTHLASLTSSSTAASNGASFRFESWNTNPNYTADGNFLDPLNIRRGLLGPSAATRYEDSYKATGNEVATAINTGALRGAGFGFSGTPDGASFVGGKFTAGDKIIATGTVAVKSHYNTWNLSSDGRDGKLHCTANGYGDAWNVDPSGDFNVFRTIKTANPPSGTAEPWAFGSYAGGIVQVGVNGSRVQLDGGSAIRKGTITLVAGSATISDAAVAPGTYIQLGYVTPQGAPGAVFVGSKTAGVGFVIRSTSNTDTSVIKYIEVDQ